MKSVAIRHYYPENEKRLKVEWKFCKKCNFDCSYCSKYIHDNSSPWKNLTEYKMVVDKLVACTDKEIWLSFTGGEPCIYPQFQELLRYCKENGIYYMSVCSNGSRSAEYYVGLMEYLNNIVISYHFEYKVDVISSILGIKEYIKDLNKTMHVHVMMLPGHFDKAREVMRILKENDVLFGVRRIRPLYMPDGSVTNPYQKGGDLKLKEDGPDYSGDDNYYSKEESLFFEGEIHEYI
jgi:MoaA/NifB/PqqE/SkfB family radical SAM enzyme